MWRNVHGQKGLASGWLPQLRGLRDSLHRVMTSESALSIPTSNSTWSYPYIRMASSSGGKAAFPRAKY